MEIHPGTNRMLTSQSGANFLFTYYIPVYFQAIMGMSAARSGIVNLPFIVLSCTRPSSQLFYRLLTRHSGICRHFRHRHHACGILHGLLGLW